MSEIESLNNQILNLTNTYNALKYSSDEIQKNLEDEVTIRKKTLWEQIILTL